MEKTEEAKIEENFKELLNEVSKIGEIIEEIPDADESEETEDGSEDQDADTEQQAVSTVKPVPVAAPKMALTDENLEEYVYNSATSLINSSLYTLDKVKKSVSSVMDHKELTALAELIKATTSSIDVLNKVVVENKKMKNAKDIKTMDIEAKKEIGNTKIKNQTNILVASREEILKQLVEKTLDADKIIDVPPEDFTIENDK